MSAPVWRQLDRGRVQHALSLFWLPGGPVPRCNLRAADPGVDGLHDRPDLPKCRRCLAALERRGE